MKLTFKCPTFAIVLGICLTYGCSIKNQENEQMNLSIGVSQQTINPPLGSFIAGDRQNRVFTGILDSLYAKAIVAFDGQQAVAVVTLDCIGLLYPDLQKIREKISKENFPIPLSPQNILISSTHTHSGPDVVGLWGKDYTASGVDPAYMETLTEAVVAQIKAAARNMKPAIGYYGQTSFGEGVVENICDEEIDRTLTTLVFENPNGEAIVSLTNFACHPTFLDGTFSEISADFIAGFYKEMKKAYPTGEHLFFQGAIGGWIQPTHGRGDYQTALNFGKEMAIAGIKSLKEPKYLQSHKISFQSETINFPIANPGWKQMMQAGIIKLPVSDELKTELVCMRIGEATFVTHPGETAPAYGLQSKAFMPEGPQFVIGLGQDALGYILKPSYFSDQSLPHAPYLTSMSLGPQTGPLLMEGLERLLINDK
jgi:hypothetical protein